MVRASFFEPLKLRPADCLFDSVERVMQFVYGCERGEAYIADGHTPLSYTYYLAGISWTNLLRSENTILPPRPEFLDEVITAVLDWYDRDCAKTRMMSAARIDDLGKVVTRDVNDPKNSTDLTVWKSAALNYAMFVERQRRDRGK